MLSGGLDMSADKNDLLKLVQEKIGQIDNLMKEVN